MELDGEVVLAAGETKELEDDVAEKILAAYPKNAQEQEEKPKRARKPKK